MPWPGRVGCEGRHQSIKASSTSRRRPVLIRCSTRTTSNMNLPEVSCGCGLWLRCTMRPTRDESPGRRTDIPRPLPISLNSIFPLRSLAALVAIHLPYPYGLANGAFHDFLCDCFYGSNVQFIGNARPIGPLVMRRYVKAGGPVFSAAIAKAEPCRS